MLKRWRTTQKAKALELGVRVTEETWVFSWGTGDPVSPGAMSKCYARLMRAAN